MEHLVSTIKLQAVLSFHTKFAPENVQKSSNGLTCYKGVPFPLLKST
jgi:hypothetical protein